MLGNDTSLWKAVHPLLYLAVEVALRGGFVGKLAVLDYIFWHVRKATLHVFIPGHWGIEIKILDVHGHKFCPCCEYYAVDEQFNGE